MIKKLVILICMLRVNQKNVIYAQEKYFSFHENVYILFICTLGNGKRKLCGMSYDLI